MLRTVNNYITKTKQNFQVKKPWDNVIIFVLNVLIAIPVFIIVHQNTIKQNEFRIGASELIEKF